MPFVTVTAQPPADAPRVLRSVAQAVAAALGLQPADVYIALVATAAARDGTGSPAEFATVDLRGRSRLPDAERRAAAAAAYAVAAAWSYSADSVAAAWHGSP